MKYNLERHRSSYLSKRQNEARFITGRLYSHFKLEEMRQEIKIIKDKEVETRQELESAKAKGIQAPEFEIDDQF